jgi:1-acyl-sn-glycerol-3-phosphate acyltransferase
LISSLRIAFAATLVGLNTLIHALPLLGLAVVKLALPVARWRDAISSLLTRMAESWIGVNSAAIRAFTPTRIVLIGEFAPDPRGRYLVLCNHRSWCDIPMLQAAFNRRIPLLRFFLKQELIWVPVLGLAWWALDFPFMRRHSRAKLQRDPNLRGKDLEATRRACAKFAARPVSIMNFVEGTRFTAAKHAARASPYRHLLRPRAGGTAAVLDAMAGKLDAVLDVTLVYSDAEPSIAALLAGRLGRVEVHLRERTIPADLAQGGDYESDAGYRIACQRWLNALWVEKDALLGTRLADTGAAPE